MTMTMVEDDLVAAARHEDQESTSKLTIATAPLTPQIKDQYESGVPTSASTLSSAPSLDSNQKNYPTKNGGDDAPLNSCSSPYDALTWLGSQELQLQLPDMMSRSSSRVGIPTADDETDVSVASGAYFDPVDLDSSNWMKAIRMDGPTFGFAMVALATALVHPVLFVAGALTAFGTLHAVGAGYEYCSKGGGNSKTSEDTAASWENSMLTICLRGAAPQEPLPETELEECEEEPQSAQPAQPAKDDKLLLDSYPTTIELANGETANVDCGNDPPDPAILTLEPEVETKETVPEKPQPLSKELLEQAYPPLANTVVKGASFPGLHAIEFFRVFFADEAPYNFMELQKQRGDQDIVYGKWQQLSPEQPVSLHHEGMDKQRTTTTPLPSPLAGWNSSFQGRTLSFRAKTNNFIGPVYATTRKTQRVLLHHKTMIVMESRTDLSDIPFSDRFYVLERWIVRAEKVKDETANSNDKGKSKYKYVSTLHATSQVVFTQSCQFASQIKTKSASTIQELVKCWCTMAKEALKLTEQRKSLRLKHEQEEHSDADYYDETDHEEENIDTKQKQWQQQQHSKENKPPTTHEDSGEGIEVTWRPGCKDLPPPSQVDREVAMRPRRQLRHSGSAPLPSYRGRAFQGIRRSVSSLWKR